MAKAWDVPGLEPDARFRDAAGRVILTRWCEMMSYRDGTLLGEDIEELHAMRVSSRRLRAAMDAFAAVFPTRSFKRHLSRVKEITDTLGAARDLDVAIAGLAEISLEFTPDEQIGIAALIGEYREGRVGESARIDVLFSRLREEQYGQTFTRWVRRHTGIDVLSLEPRPPDEPGD